VTQIYRRSKGFNLGDLVDSVEEFTAFAREHGPGRYDVDEHPPRPVEGSNATARAWGTVIHQPDGRVALNPFFFGDQVPVERM